MKSVEVNGVELEYEQVGSGEPVLLISPVLADGFLPLVSRAGAGRFLPADPLPQAWLGRQHAHRAAGEHRRPRGRRRGAARARSACTRAHVVGHSSGAAVAAQLALDRPDLVHTLTLLELSLFSVPSGRAFLEAAGPAFEAYGSGDHAGALAIFMSTVSGLDWADCQALLEERCPRRRGPDDRGRRHLLRRRAAGPDRMVVRRRADSRDRPARPVRHLARRPGLYGWRSPTSCAPPSPASRRSRSTASATSCTSSAPSRSPEPLRGSLSETRSPARLGHLGRRRTGRKRQLGQLRQAAEHEDVNARASGRHGCSRGCESRRPRVTARRLHAGTRDRAGHQQRARDTHHGQPHMSPRPREAIPADSTASVKGGIPGELRRPTESFGSLRLACPGVVARSDRWPDSFLATTHGSSSDVACPLRDRSSSQAGASAVLRHGTRDARAGRKPTSRRSRTAKEGVA